MLNIHGYIAYTCTGFSMLPLLRQNRDIVIINLTGRERCKKYDVVLYKCKQEYILHRILKVCPNDYVLCGDHNIRREYGITDKQILGVMTQIIRDGKSIYPTDWKYKLYVHLWCDFYYVRAVIFHVKLVVRALGRRLKQLSSGK